MTPTKKAPPPLPPRLFERFSTWYVIGYVVMVIGMAITLLLVSQQNRKLEQEVDNRAFAQCKAANEGRAAIISSFGIYTNALIAASNQNDEPHTPQEEAQRQESIDRFRNLVDEGLSALKPLDCKQELEEGGK